MCMVEKSVSTLHSSLFTLHYFGSEQVGFPATCTGDCGGVEACHAGGGTQPETQW